MNSMNINTICLIGYTLLKIGDCVDDIEESTINCFNLINRSQSAPEISQINPSHNIVQSRMCNKHTIEYNSLKKARDLFKNSLYLNEYITDDSKQRKTLSRECDDCESSNSNKEKNITKFPTLKRSIKVWSNLNQLQTIEKNITSAIDNSSNVSDESS